jgi:hypothetical protein
LRFYVSVNSVALHKTSIYKKDNSNNVKKTDYIILASSFSDETTKLWIFYHPSNKNNSSLNQFATTTLDGTGDGNNHLSFFPEKMLLVTYSNNIDEVLIWKIKINKKAISAKIINKISVQRDFQTKIVTAFTFHPNKPILALSYENIPGPNKYVQLYNFDRIYENENENENTNNENTNNENTNNENLPGGGLQNESRFFKLVSINEKGVDGGRYELPSKTKSGKPQTRGPKDKASTAFSEICQKNNKKGECSYKFAIQETTRGSNKKVYHYEGKRVKLAKPIVLELKEKKTGKVKKVVKKYKNVIIAIH